MGILKIDITRTSGRIAIPASDNMKEKATAANRLLESGTGAGSDFLGWVGLPSSITQSEIDEIRTTADSLRSVAEVIVAVGIGGSYLGAKCVLEAMSGGFDYLKADHKEPTVVFAGQNLSEDYTYELLDALRGRSFAVIIISKSGTTTEPAIAFRILKAELLKRHGHEGAAQRIVAVTDRERGALKKLADAEGYKTFVIPDDVGGRFSVLTPVGLLPLAAAGIDIAELCRGAADMQKRTAADIPFDENPACIYAAARNGLYESGLKIEILASYEPKLQYVAEWWKQLFGESEGKQGRGIFPASVTLTADLHSMGQYIQEGERLIFETVISVGEAAHTVEVGADPADSDGLNFLAGRALSDINKMAELGVAIAHVEGGVPNIRIELPRIDEYNIGALLYFFERACGISGYMLGVNPFDQPGVEAYKKNMFALLDKPGYEKESEEIRRKL